MKDRIKALMEYKNLTAGELADILEVQRSNISHVLNGRNKPGANFLEKLLLSFPDINARWLMIGKGEMVINKTTPEVTRDTAPPQFKQAPASENTVQPVSSTEPHSVAEKAPKARKKIEKIIVLYEDGTFNDYTASIK